MPGKYRIGAIEVTPEDPRFAELLEAAYNAQQRPQCLCLGRDKPLSMYIARIGGKYWLKRMPDSGKQHGMGCGSWEMPEEFSGRADLAQSGLTQEGEETKLRLEFSLTRMGNRIPPGETGGPKEKPSVVSKGRKFTLRGLLHYLWDEAGLTKWPGHGKNRNWQYVYTSLMSAIDHKMIRNAQMRDLLYIPEPWTRANAVQIADRRRERIMKATVREGKKGQPLLLMIGDLERYQSNGNDFQAMIRDYFPNGFLVPDFLGNCFSVAAETVNKQLSKTFATINGLRDCEGPEMKISERAHMIIMATFSVASSGLPQLEEITQMLVSKEFIPIDTVQQKTLIAKLIEQDRSFTRPLRYNRETDAIMPDFLLTDHGSRPVAMFLNGNIDQLQAKLKTLPLSQEYESWFWNTTETHPPPFPPPSLTPEAVSHSLRTDKDLRAAQGDPVHGTGQNLHPTQRNAPEQNRPGPAAPAAPAPAESIHTQTGPDIFDDHEEPDFGEGPAEGGGHASQQKDSAGNEQNRVPDAETPASKTPAQQQDPARELRPQHEAGGDLRDLLPNPEPVSTAVGA